VVPSLPIPTIVGTAGGGRSQAKGDLERRGLLFAAVEEDSNHFFPVIGVVGKKQGSENQAFEGFVNAGREKSPDPFQCWVVEFE
jgi:hypothetical protein